VKRFAAAIDSNVEFACTQHLSDDEYRALVSDGLKPPAAVAALASGSENLGISERSIPAKSA